MCIPAHCSMEKRYKFHMFLLDGWGNTTFAGYITLSQVLKPDTPPALYLTRQCAPGVDSAEHQEIADFSLELERWLCEQSDFSGENAAFLRGQLIYKYITLRQVDLKTHYSRFTLPRQCDFPVPIQPGLFKVCFLKTYYRRTTLLRFDFYRALTRHMVWN